MAIYYVRAALHVLNSLWAHRDDELCKFIRNISLQKKERRKSKCTNHVTQMLPSIPSAITPLLSVGGNKGQGSAFRAFDNVEGTTSCYIGYTLVT